MSRVVARPGAAVAAAELDEAGPVGQPGHRVGVGDAVQRLLASEPVGHVPAVQDHRTDVGPVRRSEVLASR